MIPPISADCTASAEISADEAHRKLAENMAGFADSLTLVQIGQIVRLFAQAAKNAEEIGLDMIQLHGDRLAGSFSSALFNHRADAYGERTRFCVEMVRAVREAVPGMPLDYKITVRTSDPALGRGGVLLGEVCGFVPALQKAGVDSFHVALANHSNIRDTIPARNHPHLQGEGCFLHLAREVKKYTAKPVCAVGKIQTPAFAKDVLAQGFALIGLSRQLIADPEWPEKVMQGRDADIRLLYVLQQALRLLHYDGEASRLRARWEKSGRFVRRSRAVKIFQIKVRFIKAFVKF